MQFFTTADNTRGYIDGEGTILPEGATLITPEEYDTLEKADETANAALRADSNKARAAENLAAYETFITAGIPAAVAARLTGHTPKED